MSILMSPNVVYKTLEGVWGCEDRKVWWFGNRREMNDWWMIIILYDNEALGCLSSRE